MRPRNELGVGNCTAGKHCCPHPHTFPQKPPPQHSRPTTRSEDDQALQHLPKDKRSHFTIRKKQMSSASLPPTELIEQPSTNEAKVQTRSRLDVVVLLTLQRLQRASSCTAQSQIKGQSRLFFSTRRVQTHPFPTTELQNTEKRVLQTHHISWDQEQT